MGVIGDWKKMLGADWDKTYAASNTIYVARQNNVLFSVLAQFFGPDAINDRLILIETISFTTTPDDMLDSLTRIIADRSVGSLFFGNYHLMDYELMGGDARAAIIAESAKRGMKPFLPPAVPFGSKQWPTLITPGPGPTSLADLHEPRGRLGMRSSGVEVRPPATWLAKRSAIMDLNTITEVKRPASPDEITHWRDGYAWLAGGTWLFSEPQPATDTLIDLEQLGLAGPAGICRPGSTSPRPAASPSSTASPGPPSGARRRCFRECCNAFLASFKIWNAATVGGNICMSLPAGPMISLTAALEGIYTLWPRNARAARGAGRRLRHRQPRQRAAAGRAAAQHPPAGRGAVEALRLPPRLAHQARPLGGAADRHAERGGAISCSPSRRRRRARCSCASRTCRPRPSCGGRSTRASRPTAISTTCTARAAYKRHLTYYFAEQIRAELAQPRAGA